MFWRVISGVAVAAANRGRYRMTRSRFRFLTRLIAAIWVLFGIWIWKRPDTGGETRHVLTAGRVFNPAILNTGIGQYHRQPVRKNSAG